MKTGLRVLTALWALRPRPAAARVALALVGWGGGCPFSRETPVGSVRGQVLLMETGRPLSGADITLQPAGRGRRHGRPFRMRYAESGQSGWFTFTHVPAGVYSVSASSRAHSSSDTEITIDEGGTALVTLPMK